MGALGVAAWLAGCAAGWAAPGYGERLTITTGTVYSVGTLTQLKNAVSTANSAGVPATILVSNGTYTLDIPVLHLYCPDLIIRGASGDRDAVVIRGPDEGPSATATHVFLVSTSRVTIADMTLGYCRWHGIQVQGESPYDCSRLWVHNCRLVNCNEQFIKGSSADADPVGATDGIIENCLFEFTSGWAYQYYTGGIDIHKGVNWVVRDNLFRNIRNPTGQSGIAEHAVHFWKRCSTQPQNVVVERNWIVNCDRGVGFGLTDLAGGHNGGASAIRNNFVWNDGTGGNTDCGIGLEYADSVRVDNNTVHVGVYWAPIEYRFAGSSNLLFRNNLVDKAIAQRDGAPAAVKSNNLESVQSGWFKALAQGDLHLVYGVTQAIDRGCAVGEFSTDLDGEARPKLGAWDIGADEYDPATADSDGDGMTDGWEAAYGLKPLVGDGAEDKDGDTFDNLSEFIAQTNPTNRQDYFRIAGIGATTGGVAIAWSSVTARWYSVVSGTNLAGPLAHEPGCSNVAGTGGAMAYTNGPSPAAATFNRLKVRNQ